jgi:hypothetical protein
MLKKNLYIIYMDNLIRSMTIQDLDYKNLSPASQFGSVNKQMAMQYAQAAESINSSARAKLGPKNINSLTDAEFSRLLNTLTRILNH